MKKLGLGFLRLPLINNDIDYETVNSMVDYFISNGYNYFDSAYDYLDGKTDIAIKKCVVERFNREDIIIANKLPLYSFKGDENLDEIFNEQLDKCGVTYFDYYMIHNLCDNFFEVCEKLDCFKFIFDKKKEGKALKVGFSYHDDAQFLDKILTKYPEVDFVQLQINYYDWENEIIQSKKCYEIARKHNKDIIIMEPLKGGNLVNISHKFFNDFDYSIASWGMRFCDSLEGVIMILSGSSNLDELKDNINSIENFNKLTEEELVIIDKSVNFMKDSLAIVCSYCNYCLKYCPNDIPISDYFKLYNDVNLFRENFLFYNNYYNNLSKRGALASNCNKCGECVKLCTQHIDIPLNLEKVVDYFEKG